MNGLDRLSNFLGCINGGYWQYNHHQYKVSKQAIKKKQISNITWWQNFFFKRNVHERINDCVYIYDILYFP